MTKHKFPRSFPTFAKRFSTEEDCFNYIIDVRWPDGFVCSKCGHDRAYGRMGLWSLQCRRCDKIHSATAGTVMHRTRQPLCMRWFRLSAQCSRFYKWNRAAVRQAAAGVGSALV